MSSVNLAYPPGATPVAASSGNVAAATAAATIAAAPGRTIYLCGFHITSAGSTAAAKVSPTVSGIVGGVTLTYTYTSIAGVSLPNDPLCITFAPPVPGVLGGAVSVSVPTLTSGNTHTTVVAHGYYL